MSAAMREILYRAKRKTEEWVYGVPLFDLADCSFKRNGKCAWHNGELLTFFAWVDELHEYDEIEVQHETVGQCTGLTDKNGVRIFEGDIVRTETEKEYENYRFEVRFGLCGGEKNVEHEVGYIGFFFDVISDSKWIKSSIRKDPVYFLNAYPVSVIGNIHDNPELLEVKDETE